MKSPFSRVVSVDCDYNHNLLFPKFFYIVSIESSVDTDHAPIHEGFRLSLLSNSYTDSFVKKNRIFRLLSFLVDTYLFSPDLVQI